MRRLLAPLFVLVVLFGSTDAAADACNPGQTPFGDVPDTSIFCTEALWMRNALVTLGCGTGANYCGGEPVTRGQMALFMKRLAQAVAPDIVFSNAPGAGDIDTGLATCLTTPYTIPASNANHRVFLSAIGGVSFVTNGSADVFVGIEMSTNGGLFTPLLGTLRAVAPANQWTVVPVTWSQTITQGSGALLVAGSTYQWRLLLQRASFATTGEVTDTRCNLMITLPVDTTVL
jgi:hypothetical protein